MRPLSEEAAACVSCSVRTVYHTAIIVIYSYTFRQLALQFGRINVEVRLVRKKLFERQPKQ